MGGRIAAWCWHGLACVITGGVAAGLRAAAGGDLVFGGDGVGVLHHRCHSGLLSCLEARRPCDGWTVGEWFRSQNAWLGGIGSVDEAGLIRTICKMWSFLPLGHNTHCCVGVDLLRGISAHFGRARLRARLPGCRHRVQGEWPGSDSPFRVTRHPFLRIISPHRRAMAYCHRCN